MTTHHHGDQIGDHTQLQLPAKYNVPVSGPAREPIAGITTTLRERNTVEVPGIDLRVRASISPYSLQATLVATGLLFCSDTMFSCGRGRLFEGAAAQMHPSLAIFSARPAGTLVICAHE